MQTCCLTYKKVGGYLNQVAAVMHGNKSTDLLLITAILIRYNLMRLYWSDNTSERPSATGTIERLSKPPFVKPTTIKGLSVSIAIVDFL